MHDQHVAFFSLSLFHIKCAFCFSSTFFCCASADAENAIYRCRVILRSLTMMSLHFFSLLSDSSIVIKYDWRDTENRKERNDEVKCHFVVSWLTSSSSLSSRTRGLGTICEWNLWGKNFYNSINRAKIINSNTNFRQSFFLFNCSSNFRRKKEKKKSLNFTSIILPRWKFLVCNYLQISTHSRSNNRKSFIHTTVASNFFEWK